MRRERVSFGTRFVTSVAALAIVAATIGSVAPATAQATPNDKDAQAELAYSGGTDEAVAARLDGAVLEQFDHVSTYLSLSGGVLAAAHVLSDGMSSDVVGYNGGTGKKVFSVRDGFYPLIAGDGKAVVFLPDQNAQGNHERDPTLNSVWYDDVTTGHVRRLVQFKNGDLIPLHLAISPDLKTVAVAEGNDQDLFQSDIWVLSTGHRSARNVTNDDASWYPAFSPDSSTIAFMHRKGTDPCTNEIRIIAADGSSERTVAKGSCKTNLLRPIWIDAQHLVAWKWKDGQPLGLVRITVATGKTRSLLDGPVTDFSVSRDLHRIAARLDFEQIELYDLETGNVTMVPGGSDLPGGQVHLSNAYELAY